MYQKTKSHIYIGLNKAFELLTIKREGFPASARNDDEAWDLLNNPWNSYKDGFKPITIEQDERGTKLIDFCELKRLSQYLDVCARNDVFQKLYEKGLARNLDEFNDFWNWTEHNRDLLNELEDELKLVSHSYEKYKEAFLKKRHDKGIRRSKRRKKQGTGKVRAD